MTPEHRHKSLGIVIGCALFGACILLGLNSVSKGLFKIGADPKGTVSVKGLVEYPVTADVAQWRIPVYAEAPTADLARVQASEYDEALGQFLESHGLKESMVPIVPSYSVIVEPNGKERHKVTLGFRVKTQKVDAVEKAHRELYKLGGQGVRFEQGYAQEGIAPEYVYTQFNSKRPEIFSLAVKNARVMAERFADDANVKLGPVKYANQGNFDILPADSSGFDHRYAKRKIIRVVSRFTYVVE